MAIGAAESDCVAYESPRSSAVPNLSSIELSQLSRRHDSENIPTINPRPSHRRLAPYVLSRPNFGARSENCRMSASNVTENSNPDPKQMFYARRYSWTESTEFIELWSDIPRENFNDNCSDQEQSSSEKDGTSISIVVTDLIRDCSRKSSVSINHSWTELKESVELCSKIPREFDTSQNPSKDREELDEQNNGTSVSNAVEDIKYDSSLMSGNLSKHPCTESVELCRELPSEIDNSRNLSKDRKELANQNNGTSVSNNVADFRYDSSLISGNLRKHPCTVSNAVTDIKYDSSVISWDLSKHPWTASKEFVVLWSDIPSELDISHNLGESMNQNGASALSVGKQYLSTNSGIFLNSCIESEYLSDVSSIAPEDSISNKDYFQCSEKNKVTHCRLFSDCFHNRPNFVFRIRNPIYFIVMITLLSLIPISAILMGVLHFGTCPASLVDTHLIYMTGMAGVFLTGCYIAYHFTKEEMRKKDIRRGVKTFLNITAILLIVEMSFFYSMSPTFENSENYCDKIFYNYTFYTNIAAAGIVFLLVLLEYTSLKHLVDIAAF